MKHQFTFVCPTFNAATTAKQAILSLAGQTYDNWRVIVIDDCSTDQTESVIRGWMETLNLEHKLQYITNTEKKWEVANMLEGLKHCDDTDIVCRMDMDDHLIDLNSLQILNEVYQVTDIDVVWSAHRWFDGDQLTTMNISSHLPPTADPYKYPWVSSHFKTFRKSLLTNVKDENYRGPTGEYFKRIGDQAFMLPALHNARKWAYMPVTMYAYRCSLQPETFQTDDAKFQAQEAQFLRSRGYVT